MVKKFRADLHIHSCLSPCADLDMTPLRIVQRASDLGLDLIALSDHNTAENVEVTQKIARERNMTVLPAMEITTAEEVHVLALFEHMDTILELQRKVHKAISTIPVYRHDETSQPVVNEREEILSFNPLPLINATDMSLSPLIDLIHDSGGLAIACHIDREAFGIISQLGFIPEGLPLDAVEVSYRISSDEEIMTLFTGRAYPTVSFSDAHHIADMGRRVTDLYIEEPSLKEILMCLRKEEGRKAEILF